MPSIVMRKHFVSLVPVDVVGEERLAKIAHGDLVTVDPKRSRNLEWHQKYWVLCHFCARHSNYVAKRVDAIFKRKTGLTTEFQLPDGTLVQEPGSIAWANMKQDEFEDFWAHVMQVVVTDILPGVEREDLKRELLAFTKPRDQL